MRSSFLRRGNQKANNRLRSLNACSYVTLRNTLLVRLCSSAWSRKLQASICNARSHAVGRVDSKSSAAGYSYSGIAIIDRSSHTALGSVPRRVRCSGSFLCQQLRKHFFGAEMARFALIQLRFRLHARRDGHKTVEAAGVVTAVLVLCAAIHGVRRKYSMILATPRIIGRDLHHDRMFSPASRRAAPALMRCQ